MIFIIKVLAIVWKKMKNGKKKIKKRRQLQVDC